MKIFVTSFLLFAVLYGSNGQANYGSQGVKYVYVGQPCGCSKASQHSYDVQVPHIQEKQQASAIDRDYNYKIHVPQSPSIQETRYIFDFDAFLPNPPQPRKSESTYVAADYKIKPEQQRVINLPKIDDSYYVHVPETTTAASPQKSPALYSRLEAILSPSPPSCGVPTHTPRTCNCRRQNHIYTLPINYQSRYNHDNIDNDLDNDRSASESHPQFLPSQSNENSYQESEEYQHHNLRLTKRDVGSPFGAPVELFKNFNLKPKKRTRSRNGKRNPSPFKKLKLSLFQKPLFQENSYIASVPLDKIRQKRIPDGTSSCSYTYESCDPSNHTKAGCKTCYKCKCEPVEQTVSQPEPKVAQPHNMKIPYKVLGMDESTNDEPTKVVVQEFDNETPGYTGLNHDMYRNYIRQILNKYPDHMANAPTVRQQTSDLMKFISQLGSTDTTDARFTENDNAKYSLIDNLVDFYKLYEGALQNRANLGVLGSEKPFQKRGTVLEVIELNPLQIEQFQDMIKKEKN